MNRGPDIWPRIPNLTPSIRESMLSQYTILWQYCQLQPLRYKYHEARLQPQIVTSMLWRSPMSLWIPPDQFVNSHKIVYNLKYVGQRCFSTSQKPDATIFMIQPSLELCVSNSCFLYQLTSSVIIAKMVPTIINTIFNILSPWPPKTSSKFVQTFTDQIIFHSNRRWRQNDRLA